MAIFYVPETGFDPNDHKVVPKWFIRSLEGNFGQAYHIFLEFKIPSGRQVDALILSSKGAHCLEVKNKSGYVEAKVNGAWRYRLRETGEIRERQ